MERLCLVTGATGFVGSHVAERLSKQGYRVRTLVRGSSDTRLLDALGFEKVVGDLQDPPAVALAVQGVQLIVHCAAMVGDWGPVAAFRRVNVDRYETSLRRRRLGKVLLLLTLGAAGAWVIIESARALSMY